MKSQPNRNYKSNDVVMTPDYLAKKIVDHFNPIGKGLEPCAGTGNILSKLKDSDWCELSLGKDFFEYNSKVDYIFTNPPWSQFRKFLIHSMEIADEIYFLITVNHIFTKARLRDIKEKGFSIMEILFVDTPKEFPSTGFQLGVIHIKRTKNDYIKISSL